MNNSANIIEKAEHYATGILTELPDNMVYHNLNHTREVVKAAELIGKYASLSEKDMEILLLSAWFHDTGYKKTYDQHEAESVKYFEKFCKENDYQSENNNIITCCIRSTKMDVEPVTLIEKVLHDADFIHLSKKSYFDKLYMLRLEQEKTTGTSIPENQWFEENLNFLNSHRYYTEYGKTVLGPKLEKNIIIQKKMIRKLGKLQDEMIGKDLNIDTDRLKELKKKLKKVEGRPDRGIETMFRLTSRNHLQLSTMADSKANILISVNSIIISIIIGGLIKALDTNPHLIFPTYVILTINVVTIVFAILTLRPNVTKGKFTRKDIEQKNTNLLFFGNFHGMEREDYKWGMMEMLNDSNYLYSSLIDDIYFLGKVLGKKYKFLRISYNIFMFGMIFAVLAFAIANFIYNHSLAI
jgi:predicted metal-dependent HD superfamily phosphohydrolase